MFASRKPDPKAAHKELRTHLVILGVWILAIRLTPQVLDILQERSN